MKSFRSQVVNILFIALACAVSCKPTSTELTPEMKEFRLSEMVNELGKINSAGLVNSLTSDDSTLIINVSLENWEAAPIEEQNRILEELGSAWLEVSEKMGIKGDDLHRLRAIAVDRFQKEHARWTASRGVKR